MDTLLLFYKIYQGDVKPIDYIDWSLYMLENDCSSISLNILSSLREPLNIFEVEDYFRRASKELDLQEPSFEECATYYIHHLSEKILNDENNTLEIVYEIYKVVRELDYPEELEEWCTISDMMDDFLYGGNNSNWSEATLLTIIAKEAKNTLGTTGDVKSPSTAKTLKKIEEDIKNNDLGKARDRLHGLILTFPNELGLRKMLGDIYFELKYPTLAGRYWYLEESKTPEMVKACNKFEKSMGNDPNKIVRALKYKGDIESLKGLELDSSILSIQHKVKEKLLEEPDDESLKASNKIITIGCLLIIILIIIFVSIGVYTFFNWIF